MKKLLIISMVALTCLTSSINASATINEIDPRYESYQQYLNGPDYFTEEYQSILNEKKGKTKEYVEQKLKTRASGGKILSIPGYSQDNGDYCAPAAVQNILKYANGSSPNQSDLAHNMGTNSNGTLVYRVAQELNAKTNFNYAYELIYNNSVGNAAINTIDMGYPLVYNVMTKSLNSNYSFNSPHYIVGTGYKYGFSGSSGYSDLLYFDVYGFDSSVFGSRWTSVTNMQNAIEANAGYYIW